MPPKKAPAAKPADSKSLAISKSEKQALTKAQQTFNRLVKRIENLQKAMVTDAEILNEKLQFYAEKMQPLEVEQTRLRKEVLRLLFPFFVEKKPLGKRDKNVLREILGTLLDNILAVEPEAGEELAPVFEAVEGMTLKEAEQQESDRMKGQMEAMFQAMGIDMDFSGLDMNMDPEALEKKLAEMDEDFQRQMEAKDQGKTVRKKTKKQLEKEERERQADALKNKSVGSIYKQLAKMLHPDLEPDPAEKARKESVMKELTTAYKNNDLHTLLKLELQWIQAQENNLDKLTEEKLSIYNQVLKEQVADLEEEVFMLEQHPRFQVLNRFQMFPGSLKYLNLKPIEKRMRDSLKSLEGTRDRMQTGDALAEVKTVIEVYKGY